MTCQAHKGGSEASGLASADFGASWRPCPCARACAGAGTCMLVYGRERALASALLRTGALALVSRRMRMRVRALLRLTAKT